jgi:hypothetical protein
MPESKHRRSGKNRPRDFQTHAPEKKPEPSPPWVPVAGTALLVLGVVVILVGYLDEVQNIIRTWPLLGTNWGLVGGFALLMAGFGFLTRWR